MITCAHTHTCVYCYIIVTHYIHCYLIFTHHSNTQLDLIRYKLHTYLMWAVLVLAHTGFFIAFLVKTTDLKVCGGVYV